MARSSTGWKRSATSNTASDKQPHTPWKKELLKEKVNADLLAFIKS